MPEEISVQILSQASENIQKLFDLSTRIDERVKQLQIHQENLDRKIEDINRRHIETAQKVAVIESKLSGDILLAEKVGECEDAANQLDKRIVVLEGDHTKNNDRWNKIATFLIQLVWVVLAAYLLTKLNLQPPAVP